MEKIRDAPSFDGASTRSSLLADYSPEALEGALLARPSRRRGWLVRRMLLVADVLALALAFLVAELAFGRRGGSLNELTEYLLFLGTLPAWVVGMKLYRLYDLDEERTDHSTVDEIVSFFHLVTVGAFMLFIGAWLVGVAIPDPRKLATFWISAIVFVGLGRTAARALARRTDAYRQSAIIVGGDWVARAIARKLRQHPEYGIDLVGFVDGDESDAHAPLLGSAEDLPRIIELYDVERVIVAFGDRTPARTVDLVRSLNGFDVQVDLVPRLFELISPGVRVHTVEGLPLLGLPPARLSSSSQLLKRASDVIVAGISLFVLAPAFVLIALAIRLDSNGPIFFRQVRRGRGDQLFTLLKFRTMVADADDRKAEFAHLNKHVLEGGDARMFKIENDPRVTRVGRFLRRTLLDELPQLVNVLKGDMSLVGPRPLILDEDQHVQSWARRRLDLKPGMTGLWQVLGRQAISFEEMVRLDYIYVTTWTLGLDLRLLLRTIPLVVKGSGGSY